MIFMKTQKLLQYTIITVTLATNWHVMSSESLHRSSAHGNAGSSCGNNISSTRNLFLHHIGNITSKHPFASGLALALLPHLLPNTCLTNRWWVRPALGIALGFLARRYLDNSQESQSPREHSLYPQWHLRCSENVLVLSMLLLLIRPYASPVVNKWFERMPFLTPRMILAGGLGGTCVYAYYRHTHSQDSRDSTFSSSSSSSSSSSQVIGATGDEEEGQGSEDEEGERPTGRPTDYRVASTGQSRGHTNQFGYIDYITDQLVISLETSLCYTSEQCAIIKEIYSLKIKKDIDKLCDNPREFIKEWSDNRARRIAKPTNKEDNVDPDSQ